MAPGSILIISISITFILFCYLLCFYILLCIFISKIPKIFYLSDLTLVSDREGIDNPFFALVARFLFVCVGAWDSRVVSYWIDTLVLKILTLLCCISLSSSREYNTSSRSSKKNYDAVAVEAYTKVIYQVPITNPYPSH